MKTLSNNGIEAFAAAAKRFRAWAGKGTDHGGEAVRLALQRIMALDLAAFALPPPWHGDLADQPAAAGISEEERRRISRIAFRLPFTSRARVFAPLKIPPEEPVIGSIADDMEEIYADVISGLREYEAGRIAQAVWEWGFNLQSHWGPHATGAMGALHHWLSEHAWEQFSSNPAGES